MKVQKANFSNLGKGDGEREKKVGTQKAKLLNIKILR